jgi:hypothetical protein
MRRLALLVLLLGSVAFAQGDGQRVQCCHGCNSFYCNRQNCGDKCGMGPHCAGCWKSCHHAAG